METTYIGEILMLAGSKVPEGFLPCDGREYPIQQYETLYSLIENMYGGDGQTTFCVPDLRGRVPVHAGTGPQLSPYPMATPGGAERVPLQANQLGGHSHDLMGINDLGTSRTATGAYLARPSGLGKMYRTLESPLTEVPLAPEAIGITGGTVGHQNRQPCLAINFVIAYDGMFPPHPH